MTPKNTIAIATPAAQAAGDEPLDDRAETDREEHGDDDQDDDAAGLDDRLDEEPGDEDAQGAEEPEHERRVPADRSAETAELRVRSVAVDLPLERLHGPLGRARVLLGRAGLGMGGRGVVGHSVGRGAVVLGRFFGVRHPSALDR